MIYDGTASVMLKKLVDEAPNYANYALQQAAVQMQKAIKAEIAVRSGETHQWGLQHNKRRGKTYLLSYGKVRKPLFSRWKKEDGTPEHGLEKFVYFRMYPMTHKALIGFINTKSFTAYDFKNGDMKIYEDSVPGTMTKEIGQRMEYGETITPSEKQKRLFVASGLKRPHTIKRQAHPVVRPAFRKSRNKLIDIITKEYQGVFA